MASQKKRRLRKIETSDDEDMEKLGTGESDRIEEKEAISVEETDTQREMKILSFLFAKQPYGDLE